MKLIFIAFLLAATRLTAQTEDCTGYIIKINGDTVKGTIAVPIYKKAIGKSKEIQFADMGPGIKFKEGTSREKKYKPDDVSGFGFDYSSQSYHFEVLDMQANYGKKAPKLLAKMTNDLRFFLLRVDEGPLPIYKEYWNSEETKSKNPFAEDRLDNRITTISKNIELYIKNHEGTFVEISPTTGEGKKLKGFLEKYLKLEKGFLDTVDDKAKFEDAEDILRKYNTWKKSKE